MRRQTPLAWCQPVALQNTSRRSTSNTNISFAKLILITSMTGCKQDCRPVCINVTQSWYAGEQLLAEQRDEGLRSTLTAALSRVMSANGLNHSMDRNNKKAFRVNLGSFVLDARSIVRVR